MTVMEESDSTGEFDIVTTGSVAATPGGPAAVSTRSSPPLGGDRSHLVALMLLPFTFTLRLLTWTCVLYLMSYGMVALNASMVHDIPANAPLIGVADMLQSAPELVRDWAGSALSPPVPTDDPVAVAIVSAGAWALRRSLRPMSRRRRRDPVPVGGVAAQAASTSATVDDDVAGAGQRRKRRIDGVHAALAQLDAEWLCYEMDLEAYYLAKPVLRDEAVPQTAAYRSALYELRSLADSLGEASADAQIAAAEGAAEAALLAWGVANDHALAVGVSDRSPTERAALRRLHALTAQLADPSTPRPMWSSLVEAISREMGKLSTVPGSWEHLTRVPELANRNPAAIAATSHY